jgi:hypothetical protein
LKQAATDPTGESIELSPASVKKTTKSFHYATDKMTVVTAG